MPAICEPGNSLEPLSIFKTHSLDGKFWYAVIFCPMKGSIQHILTVMSKHAFFFFFFSLICDNVVREYSAYIARSYIAPGYKLGRITGEQKKKKSIMVIYVEEKYN